MPVTTYRKILPDGQTTELTPDQITTDLTEWSEQSLTTEEKTDFDLQWEQKKQIREQDPNQPTPEWDAWFNRFMQENGIIVLLDGMTIEKYEDLQDDYSIQSYERFYSVDAQGNRELLNADQLGDLWNSWLSSLSVTESQEFQAASDRNTQLLSDFTGAEYQKPVDPVFDQYWNRFLTENDLEYEIITVPEPDDTVQAMPDDLPESDLVNVDVPVDDSDTDNL